MPSTTSVASHSPKSRSLSLVVKTFDSSVVASLQLYGDNHAPLQSLQVSVGSDMLYDRLQEHLNNFLRRLVNDIERERREELGRK